MEPGGNVLLRLGTGNKGVTGLAALAATVAGPGMGQGDGCCIVCMNRHAHTQTMRRVRDLIVPSPPALWLLQTTRPPPSAG